MIAQAAAVVLLGTRLHIQRLDPAVGPVHDRCRRPDGSSHTPRRRSVSISEAKSSAAVRDRNPDNDSVEPSPLRYRTRHARLPTCSIHAMSISSFDGTCPVEPLCALAGQATNIGDHPIQRPVARFAVQTFVL